MSAQTEESARVVEVPGFAVIGISCRTDNAREARGEGCIGKQWGRLFSEGLLAKIPNRVDQAIVTVYTDYASDNDGEYTFILGAKVHDGAQISEGMVKVVVPAGNYAVFTSEQGPAEQVVPATWMRIWKTAENRAYKTDFELYDARAVDPKSAVVDIYIGVR